MSGTGALRHTFKALLSGATALRLRLPGMKPPNCRSTWRDWKFNASTYLCLRDRDDKNPERGGDDLIEECGSFQNAALDLE
jgi:hypothetical protein